MVHCIEQDSLSRRRSIYMLGKLPVSAENCIEETIKDCLTHCPTPFNAQSARIIVLLGNYHQQLWQKVLAAMQKILNNTQLQSSKIRIERFAAAHGTILFYEDKKIIANLKKQFPLYKNNMNVWAQQANGMLQYMIWQALSENDVGASLQHYNELIESEVMSWLDLPKTWQMIAQMPFGSIEQEAGEKNFVPTATRLMVLH